MTKDNGTNGTNGTNGRNGHNGKAAKQRKAGKGVSPISGVAPPVEYQWKPGQSGNPNGMPKGKRSIVGQLHKILDKEVQGKDMAEAMARIAYQRALQGDFKFWDAIVDRIDGKVADKLEAKLTSVAKAVPAKILDDVLNADRRARNNGHNGQ